MTTPAKKPFDAESHRFGMAYQHDIHSNHVFPIIIDAKGETVLTKDNQSNTAFWTPVEDLTRAPEHDLIPRQDVDALLEAGKKMIGPFSDDPNGYQIAHDMMVKALSEFQLKYGGDE